VKDPGGFEGEMQLSDPGQLGEAVTRFSVAPVNYRDVLCAVMPWPPPGQPRTPVARMAAGRVRAAGRAS
jgi:hypothetical protein